jgi:hypothetical protein
VYLAAEGKDKDEIQGSFTPFRMTTSKGKELGTSILNSLELHSYGSI